MNKNAERRRKVIATLIIVVVVAGLLLTAYILVNNFNLVEVLKKMHGS